MIQVKMILHSAITRQTSALVEIHIVNDGTGTAARGNYQWSIFGRRKQILKKGEIKNWARNSKTAAALLQRVLNDAYPKGAKL
ncbi:MAG: hypothetical protein Q7S51_10235 [Gallionellaceae bacterium]|nr:hypothetical protein [Gallionellaceae bacterium]